MRAALSLSRVRTSRALAGQRAVVPAARSGVQTFARRGVALAPLRARPLRAVGHVALVNLRVRWDAVVVIRVRLAEARGDNVAAFGAVVADKVIAAVIVAVAIALAHTKAADRANVRVPPMLRQPRGVLGLEHGGELGRGARSDDAVVVHALSLALAALGNVAADGAVVTDKTGAAVLVAVAIALAHAEAADRADVRGAAVLRQLRGVLRLVNRRLHGGEASREGNRRRDGGENDNDLHSCVFVCVRVCVCLRWGKGRSLQQVWLVGGKGWRSAVRWWRGGTGLSHELWCAENKHTRLPSWDPSESLTRRSAKGVGQLTRTASALEEDAEEDDLYRSLPHVHAVQRARASARAPDGTFASERCAAAPSVWEADARGRGVSN